jgi:hypothetical protein
MWVSNPPGGFQCNMLERWKRQNEGLGESDPGVTRRNVHFFVYFQISNIDVRIFC